jgi:hypothetical protein
MHRSPRDLLELILEIQKVPKLPDYVYLAIADSMSLHFIIPALVREIEAEVLRICWRDSYFFNE